MTDPRAVVRAALSGVAEQPPVSDEQGDQTFVIDGVPGFVQHGRLGEQVDLVTITCLAATGQPVSAQLDRWVHERNATMLLGGIVLIDATNDTVDVLLRYCLPWAELDSGQLRSVLLPVIAAAAEVRRELAAGEDRQAAQVPTISSV